MRCAYSAPYTVCTASTNCTVLDKTVGFLIYEAVTYLYKAALTQAIRHFGLAYLALYSENHVLLWDERRQLMSWSWVSLRLDSQLPKQLPTYYVTPCNNVLGKLVMPSTTQIIPCVLCSGTLKVITEDNGVLRLSLC